MAPLDDRLRLIEKEPVKPNPDPSPLEGVTAGQPGQPGHVPPQDAANDAAFSFVSVGELELKPAEYLVDGLIETETLGLVFGDPGCGKSFLAVDLAMSIATGKDFHGRTTKQGSVFFIAGEGHNGLTRRFMAWGLMHGVSLKGLPLFKSERAAQFLDAESAKSVRAAVAQMSATHGKPAMIIIDTVARNFGDGDENSTQDMSQFIAAMDDLKADHPGACVLLVHHSGHAEKGRARGAMALKAALDFEYRAVKSGQTLTLSCTKMKDAEEPAAVHFEFVTVDLDGPSGPDLRFDGKAKSSSAVLRSTTPPAQREERMSEIEKMAMNTYQAAAKERGTWGEDGFAGLHVEDWRTAFYAKHAGKSTETKKKAFQRARENLVKAGHLTVSNDLYMPADHAILNDLVLGGTRDTSGTRAGHVPAQEADIAGQAGHTPLGVSRCPV